MRLLHPPSDMPTGSSACGKYGEVGKERLGAAMPHLASIQILSVFNMAYAVDYEEGGT
jgi:hypothetical protein